MEYRGKIENGTDLVNKKYVDDRSGVTSVNGAVGDVAITYQSLPDKPTIPTITLKQWTSEDVAGGE